MKAQTFLALTLLLSAGLCAQAPSPDRSSTRSARCCHSPPTVRICNCPKCESKAKSYQLQYRNLGISEAAGTAYSGLTSRPSERPASRIFPVALLTIDLEAFR